MNIKRLLLSLSALFSAILILTFAVSAEATEDKCGENAVWSLDSETGVLSIVGTGEVDAQDPMPWYLSSMYVKEVIIGEGITVIPEKAFEDCDMIEKVTLPKSLTAIGENAFKNSDIKTIISPCSCYSAEYAEKNAQKTELIHTFGEWKVVSKQGVGVEGIDRRSCSECGAEQEKKYPALVNPFKDVPNSCWYTNEVIFCNDNGYMNGISDTNFSPNTPLTREQFVMILAKLSGADLEKIKYRAIFTDVTDGKWYTKAVVWAYDYGITNGIGSGKFGVGNRVKRQELAVFLHTYAKNFGKSLEGAYNITSYSDYNSVASWARESFSWALANKLMKGTTSKTLSPNITATRAQVAVTVKSFCENILKK